MVEQPKQLVPSHRRPGAKTRDALTLLVALAAMVTGCRKEDMAYQPKYQTYEPSAFFPDGLSARPLVEGTVIRDQGPSDAYTYQTVNTGAVPPNADFPPDFPKNGDALSRVLERGRERFNIYCAVCHGETGLGDGMIVRRGFIEPPAFVLVPGDEKEKPNRYRREQYLQSAPPAHFFNVITNGFGAMYPYASRVSPQDRWAIAAYVRVLQFSQAAPVHELAEEDRRQLSAATMAPAAGEGAAR